MLSTHFLILILFVFTYKQVNSIKEGICVDCVILTSCPGAIHLINNRSDEAVQILRSAFCGYKDNKAMLCCNQIPIPRVSKTLENHPNRHLLPESCGIRNQHQIERFMRSTSEDDYELPWLAYISWSTANETKLNCGGVVINSKYILTTAFCVLNRDIAGVRIGYRIMNENEDPYAYSDSEPTHQDIQVEEIVVHEEAHRNITYSNNIALLRLKKDIDFSIKTALPICLPIDANQLQRNLSGRLAKIAARTNATDTKLRRIYTVELPVLSKDECNSLLRNMSSYDNVDTNDICVGKPIDNSCDYAVIGGGPLVLEEDYNGASRNVVYGLSSFGYLRCNVPFPEFFVYVIEYTDWILDHLKP